MAASKLPDPDDNLYDITPWGKRHDLGKILSQDWNLFEELKTCPDRSPQYTFYSCDTAGEIKTGEDLLSKWGNMGMNVRTLIYFLDSIKLEKAMLLIRTHETVRITREPSKSIRVEEGDSLLLVCEALGFPYPDYCWIHVINTDKIKISKKHNDGRLRIANVDKSKGGSYICMVSNGMKDNDGTKIKAYSDYSHVDIYPMKTPREKSAVEKPELAPALLPGRPLITKQPEDVHINFGGSIALECNATDTEPGGYVWQRDATLIRGAIGPQYVVPTCDLFVTGAYQCIVRNQYGETMSRVCQVQVFPYIEEFLTKPVIVKQPTGKTEELGGRAIFFVEAQGIGPLFYQWHKNGNEIPGETRNEMTFTIENQSAAGIYKCRVWNKAGKGVLSNDAKLEVSTAQEQRHTAQDKVALIIGIAQYKHHTSLYSVKNDIREAIDKFGRLGFKIVSLLDLTLEEMRRALNLFRELLDEGVYGLLYVAGHGFAFQGNHYLIPWDAPIHTEPHEALCLEEEERRFQEKKPALLLLFVDVCREECIHTSINDKLGKESYTYYQQKPSIPILGNRAVFFAASNGERAYAVDSADNNKERNYTCPLGLRKNRSVFSQYLMDVIMEDKSIPQLWASFIKNYQEKCKHALPQHPELYTNMLANMRLRDSISFVGHTVKMNKRSQKWYHAHQVPPNVGYRVESLGNFSMNYSGITSNIMEIDFVPDFVPAVTKWRVRYIEESVPIEIKPIKYVVASEEEDKSECVDIGTNLKLRISNLQRLRSSLKLQLVIKLCLNLSDEERVLSCECPVNLDMGSPLFSQLTYDQNASHSHKEPEEQEEGETEHVTAHV